MAEVKLSCVCDTVTSRLVFWRGNTVRIVMFDDFFSCSQFVKTFISKSMEDSLVMRVEVVSKSYDRTGGKSCYT